MTGISNRTMCVCVCACMHAVIVELVAVALQSHIIMSLTRHCKHPYWYVLLCCLQ